MSKKRKRKFLLGELGVYNMQLAADIKYIGAAVLATDIARWSEYNRATKQTEYTYLSLDYICDNLHPEMTKSQVRTAIKHLIDNGIVDVIKGEGRNEKGQLMADCYRLSSKGKKYFSEFTDKKNISEEQEEEIEGVSPETYRKIKEKLYVDIRKDVEAELRIEERRERRKVKKKAETPVDEEFDNFVDVFKNTWNERIPKNKIRMMDTERKRKLKSIITMEKNATGEERKTVFARLLLMIEMIGENEWLCNKLSYDKGITVEWMLKEDNDFANYTKIVEGSLPGCISLEEWLER